MDIPEHYDADDAETPGEMVDPANPQDVSYTGNFPQPEHPGLPQPQAKRIEYRGGISVRNFVDEQLANSR